MPNRARRMSKFDVVRERLMAGPLMPLGPSTEPIR
jgi:hypothetical protein